MGDMEISDNSFKKMIKTKETEKLINYLPEQKNRIRCQWFVGFVSEFDSLIPCY